MLVHEVSLCRQLAAAVGRATAGRVVDTVHVEVGALRQVVPEAMTHAWTFVVRGTDLQGATLRLRLVPAQVTCLACGHTAALGPQLGFACGSCGSEDTRVTDGEQFVLVAVDVHEAPTSSPEPGNDAAPQRGRHDGALSPS